MLLTLTAADCKILEDDETAPVEVIKTPTLVVIHTLLECLTATTAPFPQVVVILGPPGNGKTFACRVYLEHMMLIQFAVNRSRVAFTHMHDPLWDTQSVSLTTGTSRGTIAPFSHVLVVDDGECREPSQLTRILRHQRRQRYHLVVLLNTEDDPALPLLLSWGANLIRLPPFTRTDLFQYLSQIELPHWQFDPTDPVDQYLGGWIWHTLGPMTPSLGLAWRWLWQADRTIDKQDEIINEEWLATVFMIGMVPMKQWAQYTKLWAQYADSVPLSLSSEQNGQIPFSEDE